MALARPLYVPSAASDGTDLVLPRRFLVERASVAFSSYQLADLVASLTLLMVVLRCASYFVAVRSVFDIALFLEDAVITPIFRFLRLILCPASSSEEEYSESLSEAGGGVAARFRTLDLPFAERFLKIATGSAGNVGACIVSMMYEVYGSNTVGYCRALKS